MLGNTQIQSACDKCIKENYKRVRNTNLALEVVAIIKFIYKMHKLNSYWLKIECYFLII